jgi:outer membrane immunogenic protein
MRRLRFAALAAVAIIGFASVASAADMPRKAPVYAPPPPPVWSWTGFYIGVNAGGSIGRDPTTQSNESTGEVLGSFTMSPAGFVGGGQIGYNWQFAPNWVVGVEGDFQGTSQKDSSCVGDCNNTFGDFYYTAEQRLKWFATARARLGYTNGDWLWYVTGGGAWGEIHNDFRVFTPTDIEASANFNLSGWVIGGGVETHLWGGWTAKAEYLYMDLGSFTDIGIDTPNTGNTFTMRSDVRDHIVRVGLNYKFF